jgi:hypothetical protein
MELESALTFPQHPATLLEPVELFPYFPFFLYLRSILILIFFLWSGFPSCLFPSGLPTNVFYGFIISHKLVEFSAQLCKQ